MESFYKQKCNLHRVISELFLLEKYEALYRSKKPCRHILVTIAQASPAKYRISGLSRAIIRIVQRVLRETASCEKVCFI